MTDAITEIAKVELPKDLLVKIDMPGLLNKLRDGFTRLDNFKKTRDQYENREWYEKFWDYVTFDDTLEHAQLNAIEAQADFSKTLGQLMIVSVLLSKKLDEQQHNIASQQKEIKKQTTSIAEHTERIDNQQVDLLKQNEELKELVTKYFELKGLTQEGAKRLIEIASEVKITKTDMLATFEFTLKHIDELLADKMSSVNALLAAQQREVNATAKRLTQQVADCQGSLSHSLQKLDSRVDEQQKVTSGGLQQLQKDTQETRMEVERQLTTLSRDIDDLDEKQANDTVNIENRLLALSGQFIQFQQQLDSNSIDLATINNQLSSVSNALQILESQHSDSARHFEEYSRSANTRFRNFTIALWSSVAFSVVILGFLLYHIWIR